jgi:thiol reductant ABC exporter CydC subunit
MMFIAYLLGAFAFIGGIGLTISSAWLITMASMQPPILTLSVAIVLVRFFGIFRSAARYGERLVSHKAVFSRLTSLRVGIYKKLSQSSIAVTHTFNSGTAVKSIVDDVERAQEYQLRIKLPQSSALISLAFGALLAFWVRPESLVFTLPACALLLAVFPSLIKRSSEPLARSIERSENRYTQLLEGSIHGATEAAIYGYLDENVERTNEVEIEIKAMEEQLLRRSWKFSTLTNSLITLCVVGFAWLAMELTQSEAVPAVQVTMLIFIPLVIFEAITTWYPNLFNAGKLLMSQHSVDTLMNTPSDEKIGTELNSPVTKITATNMTVAWTDEFMEPTSFEVSKGELLVIRGRSGSGKSTLVMGLLGLLPYKGELSFDGHAAKSFSDLGGRVVGTVQRSHIFNTSLRENLKIANQGATDSEIIDVLTLLGLDQLLNELPQGLDTIIGDFGRIISGGEAKRLSVARVLLAQADVYIFDEPTEHLDEALARRIEKSITERLTHKIAIVVTHSGWASCDKTLTMER